MSVTHTRKSSRKIKRGFGVLEAMVVVSSVSILSAVLIPHYTGVFERMRIGRARADVADIGKIVKLIALDTTVTNPACLTDFTNLTAQTAPAACTPQNAPHGVLPKCTEVQPGYMCWNGPYLTTSLKNDPWGNAYVGTQVAGTTLILVRSNGPDAQPNTADDISVLE